jgi:hypothetical protein
MIATPTIANSVGGDLVDKEGFDDALKKATERAEKAEKEAAEARSRFESLIIDRSIQDAALNNGVLPEAIADTLHRARVYGWGLNEKGEVIAKAPNGDIRYGADGATPMKPKDWVVGPLMQEAKHLFKGHSGGAAAGNGTTDWTGYNPWADKTPRREWAR